MYPSLSEGTCDITYMNLRPVKTKLKLCFPAKYFRHIFGGTPRTFRCHGDGYFILHQYSPDNAPPPSKRLSKMLGAPYGSFTNPYIDTVI